MPLLLSSLSPPSLSSSSSSSSSSSASLPTEDGASRASPPIAYCPLSGSSCSSNRSNSSSSSRLGGFLRTITAAYRRDREKDGMGDIDNGDNTAGNIEESKINDSNMMPNIQNVQHKGLSTKREISSIPKTDDNTRWVYPSSAQFYRALQLKGEETDGESMPAVVYIHNFVNEVTWSKITRLEDLHAECDKVSLTRFHGRSKDLTLTARLMNYLGSWGTLFDRHDWYIDRCGKQIRYIIDYYDDPNTDNVAQVYIHARPAAFDSIENFKDVVKQNLQSLWRRERP